MCSNLLVFSIICFFLSFAFLYLHKQKLYLKENTSLEMFFILFFTGLTVICLKISCYCCSLSNKRKNRKVATINSPNDVYS